MCFLSFEFRPLVVTNGWVIRSEFPDELNFLLTQLGVGYRLGLPENLLSDCEVPSLFMGEILCNQFTARAAEIVDAVGPILPNVDFPVRVGDLVYDFHPVLILLSTMWRVTCRRVRPENG